MIKGIYPPGTQRADTKTTEKMVLSSFPPFGALGKMVGQREASPVIPAPEDERQKTIYREDHDEHEENPPGDLDKTHIPH
jgi:hypothetical protein